MRNIEPLHTPTEITPQLEDRSALSSLYPQVKPKDDSSQVILAARLKKNFNLIKIPLYLSLAIISIAASLRIAPGIILRDPFSGVFIAIGIGLIVLGIVYWQFRNVAISLYKNSLAGRAFFGAYALSFAFPASITFVNTYSLPLESWGFMMLAFVVVQAVSVAMLLLALHARKHQFVIFLTASILVLLFTIAALNGTAFLL